MPHTKSHGFQWCLRGDGRNSDNDGRNFVMVQCMTLEAGLCWLFFSFCQLLDLNP